MKRIRASWNHTSKEIESQLVVGTIEMDWLKEIAWQLAKLREQLDTVTIHHHTPAEGDKASIRVD